MLGAKSETSASLPANEAEKLSRAVLFQMSIARRGQVPSIGWPRMRDRT